jgi:aldose 1-epimerase
MQRSPSGEQWTITRGGQSVTVVQVGGGLRRYAVDGVPVLAGYDVEDHIRAGRGQQLMPWPNRIRDGRFSVDGVDHQLALTEPARHNASHGLVRWALWDLERRADESLTVSYALHPQSGWDWHLDLTVDYSLDEDGLTVETSATNTGRGVAPFGFGVHPYVSVGTASRDEVVLEVPADRWLDVAPDRLLPVGLRDVDGTDRDFRQGRPIGTTQLDTAFTGLRRVGGAWSVRLDRPGADPVTVWGGEGLDWAQVFTGGIDGSLGEPGVAVEPMSCPPDAFNSGTDLVRLAPDETWSARWGVRAGD